VALWNLEPVTAEPRLHRRQPRYLRAAVCGLLLTLAGDQLTKAWIVSLLEPPRQRTLDLLPPVVNVRIAWNTGINFGLGHGLGESARWALVALAAVCATVALGYARRVNGHLPAIGLGLFAGGALGNAIDRIRWGAVVDFLNVTCCGLYNPWSFNVADAGIFVGLAIFAVAPSRRGDDGWR